MNTSIIDFRNPRVLLSALFLGTALFMLVRPQPTFDVRNVSIEEARAMIDGGAVVVDVRGKEAFAARHIPGAINVPLDALRNAIPLVLAQSIAAPVVVYCGDGERIGPEGTSLLNKGGYAKAVNLKSGIQGWADAGLTVAK
jgi:rhodanese-related sulfurtransferase